MYTGCSMETEIEMDFDRKCSKMKRKKDLFIIKNTRAEHFDKATST